MSDSIKSIDEKQGNLGAACFRCRGFRHACDRKKPACSRCHRRGITCVYPEAAPTLKKLQTATENLGDRIKKFNDRIKSLEQDSEPKRKIMRNAKVASTMHFSVYPCTKCYKDLQQCDLLLPKCTRCLANNFDCGYKKTEPKANHVSQVLTTMNKVMDQWQDSIDRMAKDFAQKTRDFSHKVVNKPQQTCFKITTTKKGLSVESNVNSYNDFSSLVDQFNRSMNTHTIKSSFTSLFQKDELNTSSHLSVWNLWAHPTSHEIPKDYPIDITQELTDTLVNLYCTTPCCSSIRIPLIDTKEFLKRYQDPDPANRPSTVLIYAVCAMSARNAFQLHVWNKNPIGDYSIGKALSIAYCLKGRELLSECFDEPSFDHCQAAMLLSYCNYQNGYAGVIYFYEWIAYTMAVELGLYDKKNLDPYEAMLIWAIYYFNVWYRALQGGDSTNSKGLSQCRPSLDTIPALRDDPGCIESWVWNAWVYLIQLQVIRDQTMATLNKCSKEELFKLQHSLKEFHNQLPHEWQIKKNHTDTTWLNNTVDSPISFTTSCSSIVSDSSDKIELKSFSVYCIQLVQLHYYMNQILVYEPFVPLNQPTSKFSVECLNIILNAANQMNDIFDVIKENGCHIPLVGFLFANIVYKKLMTFKHQDFNEIGKLGLSRSIDISKACVSYIHDFELARSLVNIMEVEYKQIIQQSNNNNTKLPLNTTTTNNSLLINNSNPV